MVITFLLQTGGAESLLTPNLLSLLYYKHIKTKLSLLSEPHILQLVGLHVISSSFYRVAGYSWASATHKMHASLSREGSIIVLWLLWGSYDRYNCQATCIFCQGGFHNSLRPANACLCQGTWSSLVQVMAWCQNNAKVPSQYLDMDQCGLIFI